MTTKCLFNWSSVKVYLQSDTIYAKHRWYQMFVTHRITKCGNKHNLRVVDTQNWKEVLNYSSEKPFDWNKMAIEFASS